MSYSYTTQSVNVPTVQATSYTSTHPALSTSYETNTYSNQPNLSYSYTAGTGPFNQKVNEVNTVNYSYTTPKTIETVKSSALPYGNLSQSSYATTGLSYTTPSTYTATSYTTPSTVNYTSTNVPAERSHDLTFNVEKNQQTVKSSGIPKAAGWKVNAADAHPHLANSSSVVSNGVSSYSTPSTYSYTSATNVPVERSHDLSFNVTKNQQTVKSSAVPRAAGWNVHPDDMRTNTNTSVSSSVNYTTPSSYTSYTAPSTYSYTSNTNAPVERSHDLTFNVEKNQQTVKSSGIPKAAGWKVNAADAHPHLANSSSVVSNGVSSYSTPSTYNYSYSSTSVPVERTQDLTFNVTKNQQTNKSSGVPRAAGWKVDAADAHAHLQASLSTHNNNLKTIGGEHAVRASPSSYTTNTTYSSNTYSPGTYGTNTYTAGSPTQVRNFNYEFNKPEQGNTQPKESARRSAATNVIRNVRPEDMHEHHRIEHAKKSALNVNSSPSATVRTSSAPQSYTQVTAPLSYSQVNAPQQYTSSVSYSTSGNSNTYSYY